MKIFYSDHYTIPLPPGHRFPMDKYRKVRDQLLRMGVLVETQLQAAPLADASAICLAHSPEYFAQIANGTADPKLMRRIGFPWSPELYRRSLAAVGGALAAADQALADGISGNLAGGTHHAHREGGEGYCVFNDQAVVALQILKAGKAQKVAIIDLDVHQGDGNASILGAHPQVYILSMHGEKNFPFKKVPSTVDIALPNETGDIFYLDALEKALGPLFDWGPNLVLYQAGVDPLKEDRLGKLSLSLEGLQERDWLVLSECRHRRIPVSLALGGGYAEPIELSVMAHVGTYQVARKIFG